MCKATVVYEEKLGKRREGWCVYLNKTRDFTFYSDKQVKEKIAQGEKINGLKLDANNNIVMDEEFTTSLFLKMRMMPSATNITPWFVSSIAKRGTNTNL